MVPNTIDKSNVCVCAQACVVCMCLCDTVYLCVVCVCMYLDVCIYTSKRLLEGLGDFRLGPVLLYM